MDDLRGLPSVEQLLQTEIAAGLIHLYGRALTVDAIRNTLAGIRKTHSSAVPLPLPEDILSSSQDRLVAWSQPTLIPVINATGVILHTNLGRAVLSPSALEATRAVAASFSTLEFDLESGRRGSRLIHAEKLLTRLTGTEAALVVNNNAAAVLLALTTLGRRQRVIISRTQLVEIGGGFRVPDIMRQSGAKLIEIGTTNRVHISDYEQALVEPAAMVLHAHHSNFRMIGYTSEPGLKELAATAHLKGALLMDDLGSGSLLDTAQFGLIHEPMVQESVAAGADIVCFSGDKLLGGPQAGIIIGRQELIARLKRHPMARALRADKLCLAALTATLIHYLKGDADCLVPVWQMISAGSSQLHQRALEWLESLVNLPVQAQLISGLSTVGGGSLPGETLPTTLLALKIPQPNRIIANLRRNQPPVIGRVENNLIVFDPRTVLPGQDSLLITAIQKAVELTSKSS